MGRRAGTARRALEPEALLVFAAIARWGGVRGAAARLGTPRSTVSRRLAALEASVGAPLVVRSTRRFVLTELGGALAREAEALERVLGEAEDLLRRRAREPSGLLRVAVAPVLGEEILPGVLTSLLERYPRLTIDARLSADYVDLRRGAVDVALRAAALEDASDLYAVRLGTSTSGCYVSPRYARARGLPRTPADLADHDCVVVGTRPRASWSFRSGAREISVSVSGRLRVDSFRLARDVAAEGGGVVRVASVFVEPLVAAGALVPILERYWIETPIHAVHAGPSPPIPSVRAFIDAARAAAGTALGTTTRARATRWRSA